MNYLIIAVVLLIGLSPIFWMMPSPKQKRQMQLRQTAMSLGFQIKIVDLPQTHRQAIRKQAIDHGVVYRLPWINKQKSSVAFQYLLVRGEVDPYSSHIPAAGHTLLTAALESAPKSVVAIEYATPGVAIYWRERGGKDDVEQLYQQASELRLALQEHVLDNVS